MSNEFCVLLMAYSGLLADDVELVETLEDRTIQKAHFEEQIRKEELEEEKHT